MPEPAAGSMVKGHSDPPAAINGIASPSFLPPSILSHHRSPTSQPMALQKLAVYLAFSLLQPRQQGFQELAGRVNIS
jgi:hypothetical protein